MTGETPDRTLYLVDGTSQLFRAFYAIRGLSNEKGMATNAVYGFVSMLRKLLKEEAPRFLAVAFDLPGPTFRHDRFADYKANRPPTPDDLDVQVPYAKRACEAFRVPVLELPGYEADDLIATYARLAAEAGFRVVVVASDKDLLQLVDDRVAVLNPSKNLRLDAAGVADHFGVSPDRVRDVLGLMGDAVDNIPGVPGVGRKTAQTLLKHFDTLPGVFENLAAIPKLKFRNAAVVAQSLEEHREAAFLSRQLTGIACDMPLDAQLGDLDRQPPDLAAVEEIYERLGFGRLLREQARRLAARRA